MLSAHTQEVKEGRELQVPRLKTSAGSVVAVVTGRTSAEVHACSTGEIREEEATQMRGEEADQGTVEDSDKRGEAAEAEVVH